MSNRLNSAYKVILFFALYIGNYIGAFAQIPTDIKFTNITRKDGLPEEQIGSITQDSRGFLWMGSKEGLLRYDGKNFKTWYANLKDSNTFQSNGIHVYEEYKRNQILFTSYGRLFQINTINHKIEPIEFFRHTAIFALAKIDTDVWAFCSRDSFYISDNNFVISQKMALHPYLMQSEVFVPYKFHSPYIILISSLLQKTYLYNYKTPDRLLPLTIDAKLSPLGPVLHPKHYDSATKKLYLNAFFDGWFSINVNLPQQTHYVAKKEPILGDPTTRAVFSNNNLVFQGGDRGLFITDFKNTKVFTTTTESDKPIVSNVILNIYQDKSKNVWLGTNNGLSRFSLEEPVIKYIKDKTILQNDAVKDIVKGADGVIYLLLQNKSLCKLNTDNTIQVIDKEKIIGYTWRAIANNNTIIACGGGKKLLVYDIVTGKKTNPGYLQKFYGNADLVTLVFKAKNGDLWYSINQGGGLVHNPAGTSNYINYTNHSAVPSFTHRHFNTAAEDSKGNIWFGYIRNQNLLKWDQTSQKFEETATGNLIEGFKINSGIKKLIVDSDDNLWLTLDGAGIIKYNVNTHDGKYYDINDGLPTTDITALSQDSKKRIWITTTKGLCCYIPEKDKFITFTANDGLPEDKFETDGIFYDKEKNLMYLGGNESLAWFNPDELMKKAILSKPLLYIEEVFSNNNKVYFEQNKKIEFSASENNLKFSIAAVDFERNNQLVFQYRLSGNSNSWIDLAAERIISFVDLSPGNYTFSVRGKYKGTDDWFETSFPISFKVKTPWYRTWWFILLTLAFFTFLTWFLIRWYYLNKLEKQKTQAEKIQAVEKERTRIATDMHDDIGVSLSRIKFLSEKMQLSKSVDSGIHTDLEKISIFSSEMAQKMNEIVWALNQRYDSLEDLVNFCRAYAADFLDDKNIKLNFSANLPFNKNLNGETRRAVFLILKESLNNTYKYAGATEVDIEFMIKDEKLWVTIRDNGKGFDIKAIRPFANGIQNMKKRIADIGGSIEIVNDNGTKIVLFTPLTAIV